MFVCDDLVFVHIPKTGGTFTTLVLRDCYSANRIDREIHRLRKRFGITIPFYKYRWFQLRQHAKCRDIPSEHQGKPILACIRDPVSLLESHYFFGWWKDFPDKWFNDVNVIRELYPHFPELTLDEFVVCVLEHNHWCLKPPAKLEIGPLTAEFVHYFCRDPDSIWSTSCDESSFRHAVRERQFDVHFLRQKHLADDLRAYLTAFIRPEKIDRAIASVGRVNTSRRSREKMSTPVRELILHKERFLDEIASDPAIWRNFHGAGYQTEGQTVN